MRLPALLTADLHLDESPSTEYRWGLFPWLRETIKEERVRTLCLLGDLVDKKDRHPSALVNRVAREIAAFGQELDILMIPGNHEWLKEGEEFFRFLRMLPNVRYFTEPSEDGTDAYPQSFFLPFTKNPAKDWAKLRLADTDYAHIFMHQTMNGSLSSNGERMEGEELPDLKDWPKIYSGDIHVPQQCGPIEYVGSPYHVHFGDNFKPRCVLLEKGNRAIDLHFQTISRRSIKVRSLEALEEELAHTTRPKDQVKVTIRLSEGEKHEWSRIRREAMNMLTAGALEVHGLSLEVERSDRRIEPAKLEAARDPATAILRYVRSEELTGDAYDIAMEIIES